MSAEAVDLYRSDTLLVRRVVQADTSAWVVTFDHFGVAAGFARDGFGERFLARAGVSAIHVLGRGSDWYHYPDILAACAAARASIPPGARVMSYGSSMGGFAALRLAEVLRVDVALALSPQYSIELAVVPWERRWYRESMRLAVQPALTGPIRPQGRAFVVYDPGEPDRRHADLIAGDLPAILVPLPHAGHPVATFLSQAGLLRPLVLGALDGSLDTAAFRRMARGARRSSVRYLDELSLRQLPRRPRTALGLAELIVTTWPGNEDGMTARARALTALGRFDEALVLFEQLQVGARGRTRDQVHYADALAGAGRLADAVEVSRAVVARAPGEPHLRDRLAAMLDRSGDVAGAPAARTVAVAPEPKDADRADPPGSYRHRPERRPAADPPPSLLLRALRWLGRAARG